MIYYIEATDQTGSKVQIATEDRREALQSLRAFIAAKFDLVSARDEAGAALLECDLADESAIMARADRDGVRFQM